MIRERFVAIKDLQAEYINEFNRATELADASSSGSESTDGKSPSKDAKKSLYKLIVETE